MHHLKRLFSLVADAAPASVGVTAVGAGGASLAIPNWLIGVGQAVIVVAFTVGAIDRRLARANAAALEAQKAAEVARITVEKLAMKLPCIEARECPEHVG